MIRCKRLRTRNAFVVVALSLLAAGCNIHPLPENVSRASTYDIVARVRCEVKEALTDLKARVEPAERAHAQRIINLSVIGMDFVFDISEGNNIKDTDGPGGILTYNRRSFKGDDKGFLLDLTASAERSRQNTRRFRILEDLGELDKAHVNCTNATTRANWAYPITGATGMGEVVTTYIRLELLTDVARNAAINLPPDSGFREGTFSIDNKAIAFSDVLKFRTFLSVGANPTLTLTTVAGDLRLTNASLFANAQRNDVHAVIVALASNPGEDLDKVLVARDGTRRQTRTRGGSETVGRSRGSQRTAGQLQTLSSGRTDREAVSRVARDPRTATALFQKDADARTNVLLELQRLRDLEDDAREEPRRLGERLLKLLREPD